MTSDDILQELLDFRLGVIELAKKFEGKTGYTPSEVRFSMESPEIEIHFEPKSVSFDGSWDVKLSI